MDKMKQEVEKKSRYWMKIQALFTILLMLQFRNYIKPFNAHDNFTDFFSGFQFGISCFLMVYAVFRVVRCRKILQSEEAVREFYIKEHDERNAAVWAKSGGTVLYTCGLFIIGAAIVAGYFNSVVFITLLTCGAFLLLVKKSLMRYYDKTM